APPSARQSRRQKRPRIQRYIKSTYKLKRDINTHKCVDVYLKNGKVIKLNGFLDTGNNMIDPITKKVVVIVNSKKIFNEFKDLYYLVPYNTIEGSGLMKCIVPKFIYVSDIGKVNNVVIGYTSQEFKIEGVNCLLNNLLKGE
ncbi:MAG: sigma-E processing peptidase SpoIIGA, partial [Bacilli bacterium]